MIARYHETYIASHVIYYTQALWIWLTEMVHTPLRPHLSAQDGSLNTHWKCIMMEMLAYRSH